MTMLADDAGAWLLGFGLVYKESLFGVVGTALGHNRRVPKSLGPISYSTCLTYCTLGIISILFLLV